MRFGQSWPGPRTAPEAPPAGWALDELMATLEPLAALLLAAQDW
jgi:hypothetical protein